MNIESLTAGFAIGLSLILAIGAQNAFVLKQGLKREHVFAICLTCAVSDALLIAAGVGGFGYIIQRWPWFTDLMRWFGAVFLIIYGARSFWSAFNSASALAAEGQTGQSLRAAVGTTLALTWLNPHVYLDTVVLLGSIAAQYPDRFAFAAGAMSASFAFFFSLGYGARLLSPIFASRRAWQVLDVLVGLTMWVIAYNLIFRH